MKVVLALHGFLGLTSDWNEVQKEFQLLQGTKATPEYQLVPVDYMNLRGLTPDVPLDRWGENFCLWAEKNFPKREKAIAGYSLGGRLALHAVKANSKAWSKIFLLSTNPGLAEGDEKKIRKESDQRWAQRFQTVDFTTVVREWNAQAVFAKSKVEPIREAKNYDTEILARALVQWSLGKQQDFRVSFQDCAIPSHWLAGQYDQKFLKLLEQLPQEISKSTTEIVPDASHRLLFDQPLWVANAIFRNL